MSSPIPAKIQNKKGYLLRTIRDKLTISQVVSRYSSLINKGSNKYVCLCPLHKEKTPSCYLNDDLGLFYCFGCKQGGTILDFLRLAEGISLEDVPEFIMKNYGISIAVSINTDNENILEEFFNTLKNEMTESDKEFLRTFVKNKLGEYYESAIELADLIYVSRKVANTVINLLTDKEKAYLAAAGVIVYSESSSFYNVYTPFSERIVVPVRYYGKLVGLSGRFNIADKEAKKAKYIHSKFPKSEYLLFYDEARKMANKKNIDYVFVTEGMFDALALLSIGLPAVSVLGASISTAQLNLLNRAFKTVNFVFDSDESGIKAKYNTARVLIETNRPSFSSYFISLPKKTDIDDLIKTFQKNFLDKVKTRSVYDTYIDYYILISRNSVINVTDISSVKRETLNRLLPNFLSYKTNEHMFFVMQRFAERSGYSLEKIIDITELSLKNSRYSTYNISKSSELIFIPPEHRKIISSLIFLKEQGQQLPVRLIKSYANKQPEEIKELIYNVVFSELEDLYKNYPKLVQVVNYDKIYQTVEDLECVLSDYLSEQSSTLAKISNYLEKQKEKIKKQINYNIHEEKNDDSTEQRNGTTDDKTTRFIF